MTPPPEWRAEFDREVRRIAARDYGCSAPDVSRLGRLAADVWVVQMQPDADVQWLADQLAWAAFIAAGGLGTRNFGVPP